MLGTVSLIGLVLFAGIGWTEPPKWLAWIGLAGMVACFIGLTVATGRLTDPRRKHR